MPRPVRRDQLPAALGEDLLIREVVFASNGRALRAAVDEHNPWTRITPARDVNRTCVPLITAFTCSDARASDGIRGR